jgi:S-adenosylmethionine:tRNA ribosyltransferase-isomerase
VKIADLRYELDSSRIAQAPASPRDSARLFVARAAGAERHRVVRDLPSLVEPGTLVVVNDTRVRKARLRGTKRGSGGAVEFLLVRPLEQRAGGGRWECMGRASKPLRPGAIVDFAGIEATVIERRGKIVVAELVANAGGSLESAIEAAGEVPLPPYIARAANAEDAENYQTMFAREIGASAAPTASLHFTPALVEALRAKNVQFATTTLHVGLGTFETPTVEDLDDHPMHAEPYGMPRETVEAIAEARRRGSPVLAIGTTVVRALESAADPERPGHVLAGAAETRLLIQPGYRFRVVDRMLTNFHLPESTLLALVGAFVGLEPMWAVYREALAAEYRFFSYGDAMLLERLDS